jgi:hypothetical protein
MSLRRVHPGLVLQRVITFRRVWANNMFFRFQEIKSCVTRKAKMTNYYTSGCTSARRQDKSVKPNGFGLNNAKSFRKLSILQV